MQALKDFLVVVALVLGIVAIARWADAIGEKRMQRIERECRAAFAVARTPSDSLMIFTQMKGCR